MSTSPENSRTWYLYALECRGGKLYIGITVDIERRVKLHCNGKGAAFTRINPPERLLAVSEIGDHKTAARLERKLKRAKTHIKWEWVHTHSV